MQPEHVAISEPHLWTQGPKIRGAIVIHHPNGVALSITHSPEEWFIRKQIAQASPLGNGQRCLVRIPRTSKLPGFQGAVQDTLRVAGPEPRACLDRLLQEVQDWALGQAGLGGSIALVRHSDAVLFFHKGRSHSLPKPLASRWLGLRHVLAEDVAATQMDTTSAIWVKLPKTAHGMMALRAEVQAQARPTREDGPS